ncbi:hypothetical protein EGW08_021755 [Elysia chlorotica]|uniref:Endonuclease/exonuclease/phosphatase domain-containing protein n=1 Tax=Elysia chlorotica TaxID=188477 RepID=A0A3S1BMG6_ELYCH|nr:hypothetical protein EGW08_021755 [Elysia chlorotica]
MDPNGKRLRTAPGSCSVTPGGCPRGQKPEPLKILLLNVQGFAHSPTWGDPKLDERGALVENLAQEINLIILNHKKITFVHSAHHTKSAIDLAVTSASTALDYEWAVHSDLCGSDHFPIFLTFRGNDSTSDDPNVFNYSKADWNSFVDLCSKSINASLLDTESPADTFTEKVLEAARASIPFHTNRGNRVRVPWFTTECREAIKK